jgi:hypothetical protein
MYAGEECVKDFCGKAKRKEIARKLGIPRRR